MHYLNDATIHIDQQALRSGLSQNLKQLETAFAEDKSVGFTQDNGTLLSLRFTDADAESDTLLKLLAASKPPSLLLSEQEVIRAWFVLAEPCDKSAWQALGQALEQTLGGIFELADTVQPLPGVNSTVLYQREVPYTLAELQRMYPARDAPKATLEPQNSLRDAIQATDLPALVAHHYPESGAKPATCGVVKAVWRGDENPSLSLFQADDGTWLYRDHGTNEAGNSFGFLVDILGISKQEAAEAIKAGTFTSLTLPPAQTTAVPAKPKKKKPHVRPQIVKTYAYNDENYYLQYEVVRFHPKRFAQRRRDPESGKWVWGLSAGDYFIGVTGDYNKAKNGEQPTRAFPAVESILYHLPELQVSKQHNTPVYLVEGEKDVETLEHYGFVATCNPLGAQKWQAHYTECLEGRDVVLLPDNDAAGSEHATLLQNALEGHVKSLKIVVLPDLKAGEDVTDWFENGHTAEELYELVNPNQGMSEESFEEMRQKLWEAYNAKAVPSFTHPISCCTLEPPNALLALKSALDQPNTKDHRKVIYNAYQALVHHVS